MAGPATEEGAARLADLFGQMVDQLPDEMGIVVFLIADDGEQFQATVSSSLPPEAFAPVVRRWLERFEAGKAAPGPLRQ